MIFRKDKTSVGEVQVFLRIGGTSYFEAEESIAATIALTIGLIWKLSDGPMLTYPCPFRKSYPDVLMM